MSISLSCASYAKKGYKRLDVYSKIYDTGMKASAELYKNKMITDVEKEQVKLLGIRCWITYNIAVDSLKVYVNTESDTDRVVFEKMMHQYIINFRLFNDYITKLLKKYNIKAVKGGHWRTEYPKDHTNSETLLEYLAE